MIRPRASHRYSHSCGSSTCVSPLTSRNDRFPRSAQKPGLRVHAISMPDAAQTDKQAPSWAYPEGQSIAPAVLTPSQNLSTPHRVVRLRSSLLKSLPDTVLCHAFPLTLTTTGSLPMQLKAVWSLLLQADSEGPALIFRAVTHTLCYKVRSWRTTLRISLNGKLVICQNIPTFLWCAKLQISWETVGKVQKWRFQQFRI